MARAKSPIPPFYIGIIAFSFGLFIATLLASGSFGGAEHKTEDDGNGALFTLFGNDYTEADLPYIQASRYYDAALQAYTSKRQQILSAALDIHLDRLASEAGKSREEIRKELLSVTPVTEEDVGRFYEANRDQISQPYHEIRDALMRALNRDRLARAENQLIQDLTRQGALEIHLAPPNAPTVDMDISGFPARGPAEAAVEIVEFADYRCPHCQRAAQTLSSLSEQYPQQLRIVMLDFPILGELSGYLARAAFCVGEQGDFWAYHEQLFEHQQELTREYAISLAGKLGADPEQLQTCIDSDKAKAGIEKSLQLGVGLGLTGTPAIFINGRAYRGNDLDQTLRNQVEAVLRNVTVAQ